MVIGIRETASNRRVLFVRKMNGALGAYINHAAKHDWSTPTEFVHAPLPGNEHHIRLLRFEGTWPSDPLRFSLIKSKLSSCPAYNALSYEWGSAAPDKPIRINNRNFLIRANLHEFLTSLARSKYRDTLFFADAICINQEDIPERNAQVQQMSALYRGAQTVLVWLGAGSFDSNMIFDMCEDAVAVIESIDFGTVGGWALSRIWQRTYWTRLWIIQELLLARDVIIFCGSRSMSWSTFERLPTKDHAGGEISYVGQRMGSDSPDGRHFRRLLKELAERKQARKDETNDLLELVRRFSDSRCSDVRDRVYGLLGCSTACGEDGRGVQVVADYSTTTEVLFIRLLSTTPRRLDIRAAHAIFEILQLQDSEPNTIVCQIPRQVKDLTFENMGPSRDCYECSTYKTDVFHDQMNETHRQTLRGRTIYLITPGAQQYGMFERGMGPMWVMGFPSYECCIAEDGVASGDEVFFLEGTRAVLIQRQQPQHVHRGTRSNSSTTFRRGVLSHFKTEQQVSEALSLLPDCRPCLDMLDLTRVNVEVEERGEELDYVRAVLTMQQMVLLLRYCK
ncbi:heterokaryon incompatibility protein-domain-containing protein [Aspergillus carlsbadensis]|nr:heterokaryon incompatibility protein-domain-containing protein [Aspergillus carlsbadensis]